MRRLVLVLVLVAVTAGGVGPAAAQGAGVGAADRHAIARTVLPYFRALKRGDVARLKDYLADAAYRQYQVLLEQNADYPRFLRTFYRGTSVAMGDPTTRDGHVVVPVTLTSRSGVASVVTLQLAQDARGRWRIVAPER